MTETIYFTDHTEYGLEIMIPPHLVRVDGDGTVTLVFEYRKDALALGEALIREVEEDLVETAARSFESEDYYGGA